MRRVSVVLALLSLLRCGDGTGPTAPRAVSTPVAPAPGASVAGDWAGTITYDEPGSNAEIVIATFTQDGARVRGQIRATRFDGTFTGTLSAETLTGYLATSLDGVTYAGAAAGTASPSSVRIATRSLWYQDWTMAGNTIELTR